MPKTKAVQQAVDADGQDVYLVIADESEDFQLALRYAANRAQRDSAHLAILFVMDEEEFQHWGGIEARIHEEHRAEAERILLDAADKVKGYGGGVPCLYMEEGRRFRTIADVINRDSNIRRLMLGADAQSGHPGPLVSYFTGKGLSGLGVTLTIVPGNLTDEQVKGIF